MLQETRLLAVSCPQNDKKTKQEHLQELMYLLNDSSLLQVLDFMSRQFGDAGPDSSIGTGAEVANFRKVHATIKYLAERAN